MLTVVEDLFVKEANGLAAHVVLESDKRDDLIHSPARQLALEYAISKNFQAAGVSNLPQPYPVDREGKMSEEVLQGKKPVHRWRMDVDLSASRTGF